MPEMWGQSHIDLRTALSGIRWSQRPRRLLLRGVRLRPRELREGQPRRLQLAREYKGLVTPSFSSTCAGAPRRAAQVVEYQHFMHYDIHEACQVEKFFLSTKILSPNRKKSLAFLRVCGILYV